MVVDSASGEAVPHAAVSVRPVGDTTLVAGAIAAPDGRFRVRGLRPGRYRVRVAAVGFTPRVHNVTVPDDGRIALPPLALLRVTTALAAVQVTGRQDALTVAPDRNVYHARDLAPAAANAVDVLDAVPAVQVDPDGVVTLRGSASVAVQINGRPAPVRGPQLAAYLRGLPGRAVERIEVIPNPSAKNDPDGMAGILNVVLRQTTDLGVSGGLTTSYGGSDRRAAAGTLGYQAGRWTTLLTYGYTADAHAPQGTTERALRDGQGLTVGLADQDVAGATRIASHSLSGTADYALGPRNMLSTAVAVGRRNARASWTNDVRAYTGAVGPADAFARARDADARGTTVDVSTTFKHALGRAASAGRPHELSAEVRVTGSHDLEAARLAAAPTAAALDAAFDGPAPAVGQETNDTDLRQREAIAQADYTRALTARRKLEAGVKHDARQIDRDFRVAQDAAGTGAWTPGALGNTFALHEQVDAAYAVYNDGVGWVDVEAGLRAEHATRALTFAGTRVPRAFGSFFPSTAVTVHPSDATTLRLGYARRINRPGATELNPFPTYTDNQNVVLGTPQLTPEYINAVELGLTHAGPRGTVQLSPFYRNSTHDIRTVVDPAAVVDGRSVTTVTYRNLAHNVSWGTDLNATRRLGTRVSLLAAGTVFRMVTGDGSNTVTGSDATAALVRVNATAQVTPGLSVQGGYFYRSPINIEGGRFLSTQSATLSARQVLPANRGALSLRVVDPFNTSRFLVEVAGGGVAQRSFRRQDMRAVYLGYQHTLGRAPKIRVLRPEDHQATPFGG